MVIKKIVINNFMCYHGKNDFILENGLNIILGDNGEGKSKFYEALDWLLNGDQNVRYSPVILASAMAKKEIFTGSAFDVFVEIVIERGYDMVKLKRSFSIAKEESGEFNNSNPKITGTITNIKGEREQTDGDRLLNRIFPPEIRKYSMFKGESELNIFNNSNALSVLIKSFSDAKHFDKYSEEIKELVKKAESAVNAATRKNSSNKREYEKLEKKIRENNVLKTNFERILNEGQAGIEKIQRNLENVEKHIDNAEQIADLKGKIKDIKSKVSKISGRIKENYTDYLFDDKWILSNFESIHEEFSTKIDAFEKLRRKEERKFNAENIRKEVVEDLKKPQILPLPLHVPSKNYMEEMIHDKHCKVCDRPFSEGDSSYQFMVKKLNNYLESQKVEKPKKKEEKKLYSRNFLKDLIYLKNRQEDDLSNLKGIKEEIKNTFEFNLRIKQDIILERTKLQDLEETLDEIVVGAGEGEGKLTSMLSNYKGWQQDEKSKMATIENARKKLGNIELIIRNAEAEKNKIDIKSADDFLIKTRKLLRDIEVIFKDTKQTKYNNFVAKLERKSNDIFRKINVADFTGTIVFRHLLNRDKPMVKILLQENGKTFFNPNTSLEVSKHISILFAISELASDLKEEVYPMVFDAPTSSFGTKKMKDFLNLIHETKKQTIVLLKDFVETDVENPVVKEEFKNVKRMKAFWLKRDRPFNPNDLSTINTNVINI